MQRKINAFRAVFEQSLLDIAERTEPSERCIILSGGVDTCAILAAAKKHNISFEAGFTVITGEDSPDKGFSQAAAKEHGIAHHLIRITSDELVSTYLPHCVELLHTFDGMTLRNSLVVAAAFQKVSEMGFKHAIVGDGADELFGGYSFMWGDEDNPVKWKKKRDSMCAEWTFATGALAESFGLKSHSPYTEPATVKWAIENTERSDCIGMVPIRLVYGGELAERLTGKLILRKSYETVSSSRRKDPIEVGSGVTVIGHDPYWADQVSDSDFETSVMQLREKGYIIKNKEYLVNFRVFQDTFPDGLPGKRRLAIGQGCVGCCYDIGVKMFCMICGAYPAQRNLV